MKAIVFGINGQDGYYLNDRLQRSGIEVIGVSRNDSNNTWFQGSVADFNLVENLIKAHQPTFVFHLAANSSTKHIALFENHETISTGTNNILEAVKIHSPSTKVFITGSGVQFKNNGTPINENDEFEASSPYAVARIQSVFAARYYRSLGIQAYVGYLFHHESPYRKIHHVSKMISERVKGISEGVLGNIVLGDIGVKKEWGFAGDIADGIVKLVMQDEVFESTIGTGVAYSIEDWLKACFDLIGKDWEKHVTVVSAGFKAEYQILVSNPATINKIGWFPKKTFKELAELMTGVNLAK